MCPPKTAPLLIVEYTAALAGTRVGRAEHRFALGNGDFHWFESALRGIGAGRKSAASWWFRAKYRASAPSSRTGNLDFSRQRHSRQERTGRHRREVWAHLSPLLPATALLIILPGARRGDTLELVGETGSGRFRQTISRAQAPDNPLWGGARTRRFLVGKHAQRRGFAASIFRCVPSFSVPLRASELEPGPLVLRGGQTVRVDGRTYPIVP